MLLEHAAGHSCAASREVTEVGYLLTRVADAELQTTPQVIPPVRALLLPPCGLQRTSARGRATERAALSPELQRARQTLGLRVLLRLAGPHLDALLRDADAQVAADDTDEAKEARLSALLDDVAAVVCGLGSEGEEPLFELAARFVAKVEAPGGASAQRHEKSAMLGCGGLIAGAAA